MFPLEFPFLRAVSEPRAGIDDPGYIVGAMMTPSHAHLGERLARSCRAQSLPLALFEVPSVHRSISPKGPDDLRYTKANFVHFLLRRYARPVLYLDVDCQIVERPTRIDELRAQGVDFAIFNWFAEEHTEAYIRAGIGVGAGAADHLPRDRFYRFSHSIDFMSETQLLCSGLVQWHNNTEPALRLLEQWHSVIERAPGRPDDKCLDLAFNNIPKKGPPLRSAWLDKRYARYAWWIYERPVIDHPEFPDLGRAFLPLEELDGMPRIHRGDLRERAVNYVFPKDCLIDTETRKLFRLRAGIWCEAGVISIPLWL